MTGVQTCALPIYLIKNSFAVITDSGGISEETTVLGIPCFTMRNNTERPETLTIGTNILVGTSIENLKNKFAEFLLNRPRQAGIPELWAHHLRPRGWRLPA